MCLCQLCVSVACSPCIKVRATPIPTVSTVGCSTKSTAIFDKLSFDGRSPYCCWAAPQKPLFFTFDCVSLYERSRWKGGPLHARSEDPGALTGQDALKPTEAYVDDASEARRRREFAPITAV